MASASPIASITAVLAVLVGFGLLGRALGRSQPPALDWHLEARCTPGSWTPGVTQVTNAPDLRICLDSPTVAPQGSLKAAPGRVIVPMLSGASLDAEITSVGVDRGRRVVTAVVHDPSSGQGAGNDSGVGHLTFNFVSIPVNQLPPAPFTVQDSSGTSTVSHLP